MNIHTTGQWTPLIANGAEKMKRPERARPHLSLSSKQGFPPRFVKVLEMHFGEVDEEGFAPGSLAFLFILVVVVAAHYGTKSGRLKTSNHTLSHELGSEWKSERTKERSKQGGASE